MNCDVLKMPELIYGRHSDYIPDVLTTKDSIVCSGTCLDFYSDSSFLLVNYKLEYKPVKKYQCPILTNGFSYCVMNCDGRIIRQGNCYSWKGGAEETIVNRDSSSLLHYLFFLPSFNEISSFIIKIEDGSQLYSKRPHSNPIVTIGSSLISGEGCSFPNSILNNILLQKIDKNVVGIQVGIFSLNCIKQMIDRLKPSFIVVDMTFISGEELTKTEQLIKIFKNKYEVVVIKPKKRMFRRIHNNGKTVYCLPHLDEYSFVLPDLLNDRGHYIIFELIRGVMIS